MSDTRFIMMGIVLIFAGFLVLGIFGSSHQTANIEMTEFGDCYEYSDDKKPIPINCSYKTSDQTVFFAVIVALITGGAASLIKGGKGRWDNQVRPEDMVGPGGDKNTDE